MSKPSRETPCEPRARCWTARGAMAAPFTKPRRVMLLMRPLLLRRSHFKMFAPLEPVLRNALSFFLDHFLDAGPKILEHNGNSIPPRPTGYRPSGMRCRSGLVQTLNGHTMLSPARHRTHGASLSGSRPARVTASMPVMWVHAFEIERAFDGVRQDLVISQVW